VYCGTIAIFLNSAMLQHYSIRIAATTLFNVIILVGVGVGHDWDTRNQRSVCAS